MTERIEKLVELVLRGALFPQITPVEYDREDLLLPPVAMSAKRLREYMLAQEPILNDWCSMTGAFLFDGSVEGDFFHRKGHKALQEINRAFYNKPIERFLTFEWQHSVADFSDVIQHGVEGFLRRIDQSRKAHTEHDALEFLDALKTACHAIIGRAEKCARGAEEMAAKTENSETAAKLTKLSRALLRVPNQPARSFYEAVLCLYFCHSFLPDSIGLIDRYLYPYYRKDIDSGAMTKAQAAEILQELFIGLQSHVSPENKCFTRGGECHFAIGGYTPEGKDGFNELSRLILDSLMELPLFIPQVTLRWTKKTPYEHFRYAMEYARADPHQRIAFVSDEPRVKALTEIAGLPYVDAVNYSMTGCNEPALPGGVFFGNMAANSALSITNTLYNHEDEAIACADFEAFYALFEQELVKLMELEVEYNNKFDRAKARDVNIISSLFVRGPIENAKSMTQGGCDLAISSGNMGIGLVTVIDSLVAIKQFVYDEKRVTMQELMQALKADWAGHASLRAAIRNTVSFFGNNDDRSNGIASRVTGSIYRFYRGKKNDFGYPYLMGDLVGYNPHQQYFGALTEATPDGRHSGEQISFGMGPVGGRDREGLTALLACVANAHKTGISCGASVTNLLLDERLVKDDAHFEKTVCLLETYFRMGGLHVQLNHMSKEDLVKAKADPASHKNLRVRVSGFSDYFVLLPEGLQEEILTRTEVGA
ncbi:MAG: hypothetical protein FWC27_14085 [Firmicutes bacterium]|nr:hypothetical protein [Bacillota bacterium]